VLSMRAIITRWSPFSPVLVNGPAPRLSNEQLLALVQGK
jgi:hypothetical protein